jgi:GNAT superfamily N-acetyltransferase
MNRCEPVEYSVLNRNDIPALLQLYKQLNPLDEELPLPAAQDIWDSIENANVRCFAAKQDGAVVSCCTIYIIPNLTRGGKAIGFLENVVTAEDFRRRGLATEVLRLAIEFAKSQNCYKVILQSGTDRSEAHRLYEKLGFDGSRKRAFDLRF